MRATTSSKLVSLRHSSTLKRRFSIQPPCLSGEDMRTKEEHLLRRVKRCKENEELFRLAVGGYGLFGFVYSVTLRLAPRRKLERVAELRTVEGVGEAFAERFRDGFLYGDFNLNTDDKSGEFLRQGVLTCYRLMPDDSPMSGATRALGCRMRTWREAASAR